MLSDISLPVGGFEVVSSLFLERHAFNVRNVCVRDFNPGVVCVYFHVEFRLC